MKEPWELDWRDYYRELGVTESAEDGELQTAFRALARVHHPDAQAGKTPQEANDAERRFKRIVEAYEVLRDPARRAAYDEARARSIGGAAPVPLLRVEPADVRLFSWNGDAVVRSHLAMARSAPHALVSVDCDDPRTELISVDLKPCGHGEAGAVDATVRARLASIRPHALAIEYGAGNARATQQIRAVVAPPPVLWLGRMQARGGWTAMLLLTALLTLLAIPFARAVVGVTGVYVVGAAAGLQVVGALASDTRWRTVLRPGRAHVEGGRFNWRYIAGAFVLLNAAFVIVRAVL